MSRYLSGDNEIRWPYTIGCVVSMFFVVIFASVLAQNTTNHFAVKALLWLVLLVYLCFAVLCYRRGLHRRIYTTSQRVFREFSVKRMKRKVLRAVNKIVSNPTNCLNGVVAYEVKGEDDAVWTISWWGGSNVPSIAKFDESGFYKTYGLGDEGLSILANSLHNKPDLSLHEFVQKHIDFAAADELTRATPLEVAELVRELNGLRGRTVKLVA